MPSLGERSLVEEGRALSGERRRAKEPGRHERELVRAPLSMVLQKKRRRGVRRSSDFRCLADVLAAHIFSLPWSLVDHSMASPEVVEEEKDRRKTPPKSPLAADAKPFVPSSSPLKAAAADEGKEKEQQEEEEEEEEAKESGGDEESEGDDDNNNEDSAAVLISGAAASRALLAAIMKECSREWREMPPAERAQWESIAKGKKRKRERERVLFFSFLSTTFFSLFSPFFFRIKKHSQPTRSGGRASSAGPTASPRRGRAPRIRTWRRPVARHRRASPA